MVDHPLRVAAAATAGIFDNQLLEAGVKRLAIVLGATESLGDIEQATGEIALAVIPAGVGHIFFYDATDTTTPDDGITCLVDGSGHRYHVGDSTFVYFSTVLGTLEDPPASPTIGETYIVGTAPTGAWSAYATYTTLYTRRGWVFAEPFIGRTVYDQSTGSNLQFNEDGDWVPLAVSPADGSVRPAQLQFPAGLSVEAQQNAPPGSITIGPHYLIGTAGSGAWSGHSNKIAYSTDGSAWSFIAAYEGATIYNKDTDLPMRYEGGSWIAVQKGILDQQIFTTPGAATWTKPAGVTSTSMALIELWAGGGGGGGGGGGTGGGGGGGGGYTELLIPVSLLGSTEPLNIGSPGTGGAASAAGNSGGDTSFGSLLEAFGGGGGSRGDGGNNGAGGGGGGGLSKGGNAPSQAVPGDGGAPTPGATSSHGGGTGGTTVGPTQGGKSLFGGGGGGNGSSGTGGSSRHGGGGGGGGGSGADIGGNGGVSAAGGTGGHGGTASTAGSNGVAPSGGGGGGGSGQPAGNGARGEIRVTILA